MAQKSKHKTMYLLDWLRLYYKRRIFYTAKEIAQEIINNCEAKQDTRNMIVPITDPIELGDILHKNMYTTITVVETGEWPERKAVAEFHGVTLTFPIGKKRLSDVTARRC